jgi:hypothetical protein
VYVDRAAWEALKPWDGQLALRDRAVDLLMTTPHVMSHDSAVRAHGLPLLRPALPLSHVTRPHVTGSRTEHGVKHHLAKNGLPGVVWIGGMAVTGLVRTVLDVGREQGVAAGVGVADAALRRGAPPADFAAELERMTCWPDITRARAAVELMDAGADTLGESLARLLVIELGLGVPRTQFPVRIRTGIAWVDMLLGCHVVEFDGRTKYLRADRGGVATRDVQDILWDEKQRQTDVCAEGLGMSRLVWADLLGARREEAKARLATEYAVTVRTYGDRLPDRLAQFAEQMRAERERRIYGSLAFRRGA